VLWQWGLSWPSRCTDRHPDEAALGSSQCMPCALHWHHRPITSCSLCKCSCLAKGPLTDMHAGNRTGAKQVAEADPHADSPAAGAPIRHGIKQECTFTALHRYHKTNHVLCTWNGCAVSSSWACTRIFRCQVKQ
jgi:hypothetical protein